MPITEKQLNSKLAAVEKAMDALQKVESEYREMREQWIREQQLRRAGLTDEQIQILSANA